MLSTINWTNRSTSGFSTAFGVNAAFATAIVDRAIDDWERVITNFNFSNGGNTYALTVNGLDLSVVDANLRGQSNFSTVDADKCPTSGWVQLDNDGAGSGWYLDPVPGTATAPDDGEFSIVQNAFTASHRTAGGQDFYRVVLHEIGHVLGLSLAPGTRLNDNFAVATSSIDDVDHISRLFNVDYDGGGVDVVFTANGGGHLYEGFHPSDLMNPGRATSGIYLIRQLISNTDARILEGAYGYSITLPSTINTLFSGLNGTELTVGGTLGVDGIDVAIDGTNVNVFVNGYTETFATNTFNTILVYGNDGVDTIFVDAPKNTTVRGGNGDDTIRLRRSLTGVTTRLEGDDNNDQIQLGFNNTMDEIRGNNVIVGGFGTDYAHYEDAGLALISPYVINGFNFSRAGIALATTDATLEYNRIYNGAAGSTFYVESTRVPTTIYGGDGADTFYVGRHTDRIDDVDAPIELRGEGGTADYIEFYDTANPDAGVYNLAVDTLVRASMAAVTFSGTESFFLRAGAATDEFHVASTAAATLYRIYAGANSDRLYVRDGSPRTLSGLAGSLIFDGEAGTSDEVNFYDNDQTVAQTYTLINGTLAAAGMASVTLANVERITVQGGSSGDTFDVTPSAAIEFLVDGNGGSDTLVLRTTGTTSPTQIISTASSGRWTFANRLAVNYSDLENTGGGTTNALPVVNAFGASPTTVAQGNSTTFTATAIDSDGTVASLRYYRETNGTSGLQVGGDTLLATLTSGGTWSYTASTGGWTVGSNTLYAQATDAAGAFSAAASTSVTVTGTSTPVIGNFVVSPTSVIAGAAATLTATNVSDAQYGIAFVHFYRESNGITGYQAGAESSLNYVLGPASSYSVQFSTASLSAGTYTFYAVASNNPGTTSVASSATLSVSPASSNPTITSLTASPTIVASNGTIRLTADGVSDADGFVAAVRFYRETNGVSGHQAGGDSLFATDLNGSDGWIADLSAANLGTGTKTFYAVAYDNSGLTSAAKSASVNVTAVVAPMCVYASVLPERLPINFIALFDADVGASLDVNDVSVINRATGASYAINSVVWDSVNRGASFYMNTVPPDGNYQLTIKASGISAGGVLLAANYVNNFFLLAGDTDSDRDVDFNDLLALAKNYGQTNRSHRDGNTDRSADGSVNFDDLLLLAKNYGKTLALPAAAIEALPLSATPTRRTRSSGAMEILG